MYRRPESVLVLVYDQNQRILTLQRQDDLSFWQSVTGSLEPGEQPEQTAHREVLEEINVDIRAMGLELINLNRSTQYQIRPQWQHRYAPGVTVNTEHWFALQIPAQTQITLTEHVAYQWLSCAAALEKMWSSTNREAIKTYFPASV